MLFIIPKSQLLRIQLVGPLVTLVLCFGILGYATYQVNAQKASAQALNQKLMLMRLNYEFKVQVQEWKNLLLRTQSIEQVADLWAKFLVQEERTKQVLDSLSSFSNDDFGKKLDKIRADHLALGNHYRQGYLAFRESNFNAQLADQQVQKIDRPLSNMLSEMVGDSEWQTLQISQNNLTGLYTVLWLSSSILIIVGGSLALNSYQSVRRILKDNNEKQIHLKQLASTDAITGLVSRDAFLDEVSLLCQNSKSDNQLSILFIDFNGIQHINEVFGHTQGDEVLREIAQRLREFVQDKGLIGRFGGSSFLLAIEQDSVQQNTLEYSNDLVRDLANPFFFAGAPHYLIVNIGLVHYPAHGRDPITLMKNADLAMYQGRRMQGNYVNAYDETISRSANLFALQRKELSEALNTEQLVLYVQPIVNIKTGQIASLEALCRWQHPTRGIVSPSEFISLAEESGMIGQLGTWVMETAMQTAKQLAEPGIMIAINVSPQQLSEPGFEDKVKYLLEKYQLKAAQIELELTESVFLPEFRRSLEKLKLLGIKISIDDFGTGYSNLRFLTSTHIDKIKLDMSFIRDIQDNRHNQHIVKSVCDLANNMGLEVVCEGVESFNELDFLQSWVDCQLVQGFIYSAPKPVNIMLEQIKLNGPGCFKLG